MLRTTNHLIHQINRISDAEKAEWWNNYLQGTIDFIGVSIPDIKSIILQWYNKLEEPTELIPVADELLKQDVAEFKLAGIIMYQEILFKTEPLELILSHLNWHFEQQHIYDWNTCDWLCFRVLTPMIDSGNEDLIQRIINWHNNNYLWHARASLVAFANCKTLENQLPKLIQPMNIVVKRPERFAKSAVGTILREVFKFNPDFVINFLKENKQYLISELVDNSLKYMAQNEKEMLKEEL